MNIFIINEKVMKALCHVEGAGAFVLGSRILAPGQFSAAGAVRGAVMWVGMVSICEDFLVASDSLASKENRIKQALEELPGSVQKLIADFPNEATEFCKVYGITVATLTALGMPLPGNIILAAPAGVGANQICKFTSSYIVDTFHPSKPANPSQEVTYLTSVDVHIVGNQSNSTDEITGEL